ncbi:bifunctional phosphoribosyl-AMP cyclohydrolase/phosphoribosyl-ATP diphosphatase HisIE [Parasporobacterium paucivorans]|uniref:Histidine biosynthesis bifunctional protein HisIE n=1 Tax=Parasporobacterium paucivorans DSM 15970 TaxID=1122934 RepID=A0A1M6A5U1_9FIRM|nr:bifunctional phosphoribosyl-AMP cyclohydrolase/phosphoribosyl-ATP diphosphatase HisIE [Parasporobacterium paucivorans]SHI31828.1 phosphoribosyl-ATP pyrophosphatase /phosphoribosyl-AMP cyclohydrolase [Parasporobacterium paucivorans DSM 15970]
MNTIKMIPAIILEGEESLLRCEEYANKGADGLLLFDNSGNDADHDANISLLKNINAKVDVPFIAGGHTLRLEDVKKYLYAGAQKVFIEIKDEKSLALVTEASERFGKEKIAVYISGATQEEEYSQLNPGCFSLVLEGERSKYAGRQLSGTEYLLSAGTDIEARIKTAGNIYGIIPLLNSPDDIISYKKRLKDAGLEVFVLESNMKFSDFKSDEAGLVPVVVQDYKTSEVLMMAYMNQEAFDKTIETGRMTYYSRSREEIWIKGLTSGHFQYVRELSIDCDKDTLLARVFQVGAACHTGNRSCFYTPVAKKEYKVSNPFEVFQDVFRVIQDRKENPKDGSYTNYLFDKGIDKILKKLGEEAVEIVIAAKNPDPEEIKYEISDFLYHMMVLMAEKGVTWEEITDELNRR